MKEFTAWEYLLIDIANHWGLDKLIFEARIEWAETNINNFEKLAEERGDWKEKPMYIKTCMAIRKAQQGIPTGHLVGFDAVCSGAQIMAVLTGCESAANATGLVDPNRRADLYTDCTALMNGHLTAEGITVQANRKDVKQACMTSLYGSKKEPKNIFGDKTPELGAFYKAMQDLAPGPCELLDILVDSWKPYALSHDWQLPDGFEVKCPVTATVKSKIEVDELGHTTFTYIWKDNIGAEKGVKNSANLTHSVDSYILRQLVRRCNYDKSLVPWAYQAILTEIFDRAGPAGTTPLKAADDQLQYYIDLWERTKMADPLIIGYMGDGDVECLPLALLKQLAEVLRSMLEHKPFPVITVHDDFRAHALNVNWVRKHYRNILAELADSTVLDDLLTQLYGEPVQYQKLSNNLSEKIRNSNYALC